MQRFVITQPISHAPAASRPLLEAVKGAPGGANEVAETEIDFPVVASRSAA